MKQHTKNYLKHYNYGIDDIILCEICGSIAVDLHHIIYKSQGGSDSIDNIIALCRKCHDMAHNETFSKEYLKNIHESNF